ncbi:type II toxin-antitoxin system VapC family toxin [uncultured Parolsenella sp.]|uniref:type II toxin-antitoxin system VapC family toxin n=1 Tax=uncultured Parolsenella sp. TaxID=2083008 RepID=UPI0027DE36D2|nr:type II toxin-antitoxin system VapC family toxin [uncultured Parolsenella sp.]
MIVLDACAAVEMSRETETGRKLSSFLYSGERVTAPEYFPAEVGSALSKYVRANLMTPEEAKGRLRSSVALVDDFVPTAGLYEEAFSESLRLEQPIYDLLYLVLARRRSCALFTCDKRLRGLCRRTGVDCVDELVVNGEVWTIRSETEDFTDAAERNKSFLKLVDN